MDGIRIFCDNEYGFCQQMINIVRKASKETRKRVVISIELRCNYL